MGSRNGVELALAIIKRPLQKRNLQAIAKKLSFSENEAAQVAGVSPRTYIKLKPNSFLSIGATDNVVKLAELYEVGITTFDGNTKSLAIWLHTSFPVLEGNKPIELLNTFVGIDYVKDLLLRMEYSIPE